MVPLPNGIAIKTCPQCDYRELIDALFYLDSAAMLIPMNLAALRKFLSRHKHMYPPRYGHYGPQRRRYRLLTGDEVRRIRATLVSGPRQAGFDALLRRGMVFAEEQSREKNEQTIRWKGGVVTHTLDFEPGGTG